VTDYERSLYRGEIDRLRQEIATLEARIVELTARLADEEVQ
jgi:BMFP domain-containing protein YqiC